MTRRPGRAATVAAIASVLLASPTASAGQGGALPSGQGTASPLPALDPLRAIIARALTERIDRPMVERVARLAEPRRFTPAETPRLAQVTGRQFIEEICGTLQEGYVEILRGMNPSVPFDLDRELGAAGYGLDWPACLFVRPAGQGAPATVLARGDNPSLLQRLYIGREHGRAAARDFAERALGRPVVATNMPVGLELRPAQTLPTRLVARSGSGVALADALRAADPASVSTSPAGEGGEIVLPVEIAASDDPQLNSCDGGDPSIYPFAPALVSEAYRFSRDQWSEMYGEVTQTVHLVVVDNGFFGVRCTSPDSCPARENQRLVMGDQFPRRFFVWNRYASTELGPSFALNFSPINYSNHITRVDEVSGHGTHVAGLSIGGPTFVDQRGIFGPPDASWLKLVIINVAGGQRSFSSTSASAIFANISDVGGRRVVNLSLTINTAGASDQLGIIQRAVRDNQGALFVAAAGNRGKNIAATSLAPARLSQEYGNVIAVGSVDGTGRLSRFSNHSGTFVNIAAPGCRLGSWLSADPALQPMSGTSQAAPIVSFAAALLRSIWNAPPERIRARLEYGGTLLDNGGDRERISSRTSLDIVRTLLFRQDVISFRDEGRTRMLLGRAEAFGGYQCSDGPVTPIDDFAERFRSIKRAADGAVYVYSREGPNGRITNCPARFDDQLAGGGANELLFHPTHEVIGNEIVALDPASTEVRQGVNVPAGRLMDLTRADVEE